MRTKAVQDENHALSMHAIRQDLESCQEHLVMREKALEKKIRDLTAVAREKALAKDLMGARRKLMDRRRTAEQLKKISNSITVIESHGEAIENVTWNRGLLDTLRASASAIRSLNVKGGIVEVENVIAEVEQEMQNANDINQVLYNGSISGTMNSMATGEYLDEDELEKDLEDLLKDDDAVVNLQADLVAPVHGQSIEVDEAVVSLQDDLVAPVHNQSIEVDTGPNADAGVVKRLKTKRRHEPRRDSGEKVMELAHG